MRSYLQRYVYHTLRKSQKEKYFPFLVLCVIRCQFSERTRASLGLRHCGKGSLAGRSGPACESTLFPVL